MKQPCLDKGDLGGSLSRIYQVKVPLDKGDLGGSLCTSCHRELLDLVYIVNNKRQH